MRRILSFTLCFFLSVVVYSQDGDTSDATGDERTSLTLEQAVNAALESSQEALRSRLDVTLARTELRSSTARLGPTVTLEAGFAYLADPPEGVSIPAGAFGTTPVVIPSEPVELVSDAENIGMSLALRLDQTLFSWGKLLGGRAVAEANVVAAVAAQQLTHRSVRRMTGESYIGLAIAEQSLPLVQEIVELFGERVADRALQLEEGAVTRADVLAEEVLLATGRTQLVRTEQAVLSAREGLRFLTGLGVDAALPEFTLTMPDESLLVAQALESHPRLTELRAREDQARIGVDIASASGLFRPDFALSLEADAQGQEIPFAEEDWDDGWQTDFQISIGARMLLYDHGQSFAQVDAAESQLAQARSGLAEYSSSLSLQIRELVAQFAVAEIGLEEADIRLADAREQDRNALVSFQNELIPRRDRLGAALALKQAELGHLAAVQALWQAWFRLEELVGPLP